MNFSAVRLAGKPHISERLGDTVAAEYPLCEQLFFSLTVFTVQIISKQQAHNFDKLIMMDTEMGILAAFGLHRTKLFPRNILKVEADMNLCLKKKPE